MVVVLEVCRVEQRPGVVDSVGMLVGCISRCSCFVKKWLLPRSLSIQARLC